LKKLKKLPISNLHSDIAQLLLFQKIPIGIMQNNDLNNHLANIISENFCFLVKVIKKLKISNIIIIESLAIVENETNKFNEVFLIKNKFNYILELVSFPKGGNGTICPPLQRTQLIILFPTNPNHRTYINTVFFTDILSSINENWIFKQRTF